MSKKVLLIILIVLFILFLFGVSKFLENNYMIQSVNKDANLENKVEELPSGNEDNNSYYEETPSAIDSSSNTVSILHEIDFESAVLKADKKVVIDFYADWCEPCNIISPMIEEIAEETKNVSFYRVNVDENNDLANRYRIIYLPTLILFESGEEQDRFIGVGYKEDLLDFIK